MCYFLSVKNRSTGRKGETMKHKNTWLAAALLLAASVSVQADILAGWWEPGTSAPEVSASGISAALDTTGWGAPIHGDGDDTFGTFAGASHDAISPGSFYNNKTMADISMTLSVTNTGTQSCSLDYFAFDTLRQKATAHSQWTLNIIGGDLGTTNGIASSAIPIGVLPVADESNNFDDFDVDLRSFGFELGTGESVLFELTFSGSSQIAGGQLFVDNLGVVGTVPEPATTGLMGFALAIAAMLRFMRR